MTLTLASKQCPRCKKLKLIGAFYLDSDRGRCTYCIKCKLAVDVVYEWRKHYRGAPKVVRRYQHNFPKGVRWSVLDDVRLVTLIILGTPHVSAGHLIGRTANGVRERLKLIRTLYPCFAPLLPTPDPIWTPRRVAVLRRLIQVEGLTQRDAAERLGCSRGAVNGAVTRYLLPRNKKASPCRQQSFQKSPSITTGSTSAALSSPARS